MNKEFMGKLEAEGQLYLYDNFFDRIEETTIKPLLEEAERAVKEAQEQELGWYDVREYKLDKARSDERITEFLGPGDCVLLLSLDGSAELKFDSPGSFAFDLEVYEEFNHSFEDLYLTNSAQAGKSLKLLFSKGKFKLTKKVPEIDLSGKIRNDYLEQITDPLNIGQIISDGHIVPHANIGCEKILVYGNTRLDKWRHPSDFTYIHGGYIYTHSIIADKLNVALLSAISANVGTLTAGLIKSTDAKTLFDLTNGFFSVSDGTHVRFKAGKLNGDYGTEVRDAAGNVTVDKGKIVGGVDYKVVTAADHIFTNSAVFVDMPGMSITKTLPKGIVLLMSKNWCNVPSVDLRVRFEVDGSPVGQESGGASGKCYACNLWTKSLAAGSHTFKIQWCTTGGAENVETSDRILIVQWWYVT